MIAPLKINGIDYVGEVVVEQRPNRQGFYLHEVEIKEKLADEFKPPTRGGHTLIVPGVSSKQASVILF